MELSALNEFVELYRKAGARLLAVSPERPDKIEKLKTKLKLNFEILFDDQNEFANQLDLVHGFEDELKEIYLGFGIDVGKSNGMQDWTLPIPGRIVIDTNGVIEKIDINANYTERPEPESTLNFLLSK